MQQLNSITVPAVEVVATPTGTLVWRLRDGRKVETNGLNLAKEVDRLTLAQHAERLGLGKLDEIVEHLEWLAPWDQQADVPFGKDRVILPVPPDPTTPTP